MRRLSSCPWLLLLCIGGCALLTLAWRGIDSAAPAHTVRLTVQIRPVFGGEALRLEDVSLTNRAGNRLSVSRLAYLVSDVSLLKQDGSSVILPDQAAYLNPAEQRDSFVLEQVPEGNYKGVSFHIGVEPKANHSDPARYPAGHPLNPIVNHLHWGWQGGYVFLAIEGRYTLPGDRLGGYSYHLATDRNLMRVSVPCALSLKDDAALTLRFDVAKVFDAKHLVKIQQPGGGDSTHSAAGDLLAAHLKSNVEHAFTFERLSNAATVPTEGLRAVSLSPHTTPFAFPQPTHFPQPELPADNPLTVEGVALGKRLFFEKRLSGNDTQSCASCHQPKSAFSHAGHAFSKGIDGKLGRRRAMPLFNLAWSGAYTWDGRRTRLRDQALAPILDVREMHQTLAQTVTKLNADKTYPGLFAAAFGSLGVTSERIGLAIEQYLLTLIAADSKFDRALRGEAEFTDQEKQGLLLFITEYDPARGKKGADCFHCHGGNLFTDFRFANNGLDSTFQDTGREQVTGRSFDRGKFKTPSLRNIELTGPYMHDGRFKTLEAVIDHYNAGVHRSPTLDPNIAKHPDDGIHLSASEKKALVAFLKTLTEVSLRPN